jgi:hypothetical protein
MQLNDVKAKREMMGDLRGIPNPMPKPGQLT